MQGTIVRMLLRNEFVADNNFLSQKNGRSAEVDESGAASTSVAPVPSASHVISISQVDPTQLYIRNLGYTIGEKRILSDINAVFRPGRLSIIVGPSGSGKTSLLSLIAGLSGNMPKNAVRSGNILYNGSELTQDKIRKIVGFVFQDDVILETMTVKEAIDMSIELRVNQQRDNKNNLSKRMLDVSQLDKAKNVVIGSPSKKGISGGERKRTAIAMELVSNPSVLLLDEPTSGLDTFTAFRIVALLRRLAHRYGRTVVATLHQPSSEIFHMIDDLYVLHDGKLVYGGPAQQLVPYFSEAGYTFEKYSNPLDVLFMDVLNPSTGDEFSEGRQMLAKKRDNYVPLESLAEYYGTSRLYDDSVAAVSVDDRAITKEMQRFRAKQWHAFKLLLMRDVRNVVRNPMIVRTKLFQTVFLAVFIAAAFWNTKFSPPPKLYQNISGVLFFLVTNAFFASFQNVLPVFSTEKPSFMREHSQGYYGTGTYFLAKIIVELPLTFVFPILTAVITYWSVGLRSGFGHFLLFTFILQLTALAGFSMGLFAACLFNDVAIALALSILILLPFMLFSGLVLNVATVPGFLRWIQWISPMRYAFTSLMTNQFGGWNAPGAQAYYVGLNAGNGLSIVVNLFILAGIFLFGLFLSYLALVRVVVKNERGNKGTLVGKVSDAIRKAVVNMRNTVKGNMRNTHNNRSQRAAGNAMPMTYVR